MNCISNCLDSDCIESSLRTLMQILASIVTMIFEVLKHYCPMKPIKEREGSEF